ncbi:MAG: hypothetical protein Q8S73_37885 [Deltaproteobacteria bacterium]|nr:hypothetical protein [Myxococcales bacterium]MDP3219933.1 hypothetical protein [Deltaproteobacteria bacterium]
MTSLGTDISTPIGADGQIGLDPYLRVVSELECLAQALARRLVTPRGSLYRHPLYGYDVRQWLNADLDDADLAEIERASAEELRADERVDDVAVVASFADEALSLVITVRALTGQTFRFILAVGQVTVALLRLESL